MIEVISKDIYKMWLDKILKESMPPFNKKEENFVEYIKGEQAKSIGKFKEYLALKKLKS